MKCKTITLIIGIIVITTLFIMTFLKISYFKRFKNNLNQIKELSINQQWDDANLKYQELYRKWEKGRYILTLSYNNEAYENLNPRYFELGAAIANKNINDVIKSVNILTKYHQDIMSIIPI